ncbi:hypothetical protein GNE10_09335 [Nostoc sp. 2RC]|nr:hypothetical protein [Nostoc sp. 2RC]
MSQNQRSPILSIKGDAALPSLLTHPTHWLLLTVILIHIQALVRANGCSPSPLPYATAGEQKKVWGVWGVWEVWEVWGVWRVIFWILS